MAEIIDWLNLAISADTNSAVRNLAAGQAVVAAAELEKRQENSIVSAVVDLYAKVRDLRQRGEAFGAFSLAITAKSMYYASLPGLHQAQLKMQLIEVDEKLNAEFVHLLTVEQIPGIVAKTRALLESTIKEAWGQIEKLLVIADKAPLPQDTFWTELKALHARPEFLRRYFDPKFTGPLGPVQPTWDLAVKEIERAYLPYVTKLEGLIANLVGKANKALEDRRKKDARTDTIVTLFVVVIVVVGILIFVSH